MLWTAPATGIEVPNCVGAMPEEKGPRIVRVGEKPAEAEQ
jgi:hypothetical protein